MRNYHPNFITRSPSLRLLQVGTLLAVFGCVALGSVTVMKRGWIGGTATIADTLASASFTALPSAQPAAPKPKAISENAIVSAAWGTTSDTIRYYEQSTGRAFSVALSTQRTDVLSDQKLPGFIRSYWVPKSSLVVSAFQRPTGVEFSLFDYATKESDKLGSDFSRLVVSPDGHRIAYFAKETAGALALTLASIDGNNPVTLFSTRAEEPDISWRTNSSLALITRRLDKPGRDLSLVEDTGAITILLKNKENLETAWSPDGQYLLYSFFAPEAGISLWLRSIATGQEVPLDIETSARKCAWHPFGYAITCGVPAKKTLTRDVPADDTATIDDVYTYDFDNNTLKKLYGGVNSTLVGVTEPILSSSGTYFVFTNIFDRKLYMLPL